LKILVFCFCFESREESETASDKKWTIVTLSWNQTGRSSMQHSLKTLQINKKITEKKNNFNENMFLKKRN